MPHKIRDLLSCIVYPILCINRTLVPECPFDSKTAMKDYLKEYVRAVRAKLKVFYVVASLIVL